MGRQRRPPKQRCPGCGGDFFGWSEGQGCPACRKESMGRAEGQPTIRELRKANQERLKSEPRRIDIWP